MAREDALSLLTFDRSPGSKFSLLNIAKSVISVQSHRNVSLSFRTHRYGDTDSSR